MDTLSEGPEIQVMWCSFLPALTRALVSSHGPVIEIGIGHFSTPVLHEYCEASRRKLISVESDPVWAKALKDVYESPFHEFVIGEYCHVLPELAKGTYGVVFIDNSPGGSGRSIPFTQFYHQTEFIVVHDYHLENSQQIDPILWAYKAKKIVYSTYNPPTLLAYR